MTTVTVDQDTGEIMEIDGDLPDDRNVVPYRPEPVGLARASDPGDMIALASKMATALRDIVERQKLYAVINGKKFPTVEAWMTIARMDNVVAREGERPIRLDDGGYEASVELMRLADGLVIGRASALCGTSGDSPWDKRGEPQRRSMAVTRATSRAFRQHYSWIMALAGYEPTPAEEMPHHAPAVPSTPPSGSSQLSGATGRAPEAATFTGKIERGSPPVDLELRPQPDGDVFGFALKVGTRRVQVIAEDAMATALATVADSLLNAEATIDGRLVMVPWEKDGKSMPPFRRVLLERISTADITLPAPPDDGNAELDALVA